MTFGKSSKSGAKLQSVPLSDTVFSRIRTEAEEIVHRDPELTGWIFETVLNHEVLESAIIHRLAARLGHEEVSADLIRQTYLDVIARDPKIGAGFRADLLAVADRDPACQRLIEPLLYFKGFHALQTHRLAHALWNGGRRDFALYLQSRSSGGLPNRHSSGGASGPGHFPRSCDRSRDRIDRRSSRMMCRSCKM